MSRLARLAPSLALLPFLLYLTVFLLVPTITVVVGAFTEDGRFTLSNIAALVDPVTLDALWTSVVLSAVSAVIGAAFGAVLNLTMLREAPDANHMVDRLLEPTQRGGLVETELMRLTDVVVHGLHNTYLLAGALSVVALVLALLLPARLSPAQQAHH